MKKIPLTLIAGLCFSQAQAFDLPKQKIKAYECGACIELSHEALEDKWAISSHHLSDTTKNTQKSYGYKMQVNAKQLQAGVKINTLAPGAIIRITPLQNNALPILHLRTATNKMKLQEASSLYSEEESLGDIPTNLPQTVVQMKPELGFGTFVLQSNESKLKSSDQFMIQVYDKFASTYLEIETNSIHYQYGDTVRTLITLVGSNINYDEDDVSAELNGPEGQVIPLKIVRVGDNQFAANGVMHSELNVQGENWYVEVAMETSYSPTLNRHTGHTAFSYAIPSANIVTLKKDAAKPNTFVATLDVATASRYALEAVLFSKDIKGNFRPLETVQKAQWFEAGKQIMQFTFDNSNQLSEDQLYLGYLRLIDYGQLKPVYQYNQPIKLTQLAE